MDNRDIENIEFECRNCGNINTYHFEADRKICRKCGCKIWNMRLKIGE